MSQKQSHSESHGNGEATAEKPLTKAGAKKAMARFESLTRQLLTVSRARMQDEQERYEKRRSRLKRVQGSVGRITQRLQGAWNAPGAAG
jgi:hypothetical protein